MSEDRLDALKSLLEDQILEASSEDLFAHSDAAGLVPHARLFISEAVARATPVSVRSAPERLRRDRRRPVETRRQDIRRVDRRGLVGRLMFASARARVELGDRKFETLGEEEFDLLLARLDALGLVPQANDESDGKDKP